MEFSTLRDEFQKFPDRVKVSEKENVMEDHLEEMHMNKSICLVISL